MKYLRKFADGSSQELQFVRSENRMVYSNISGQLLGNETYYIFRTPSGSEIALSGSVTAHLARI